MQSGDGSNGGEGQSRFALVSLGCAKNTVDSEGIQQMLAGQGYARVEETADADIVIVNTCGFIDAARQESVDTLLELGQAKRPGRNYSRRAASPSGTPTRSAREVPEIDAIVGARNWQTVPRFAQRTDRSAAEPRQPGGSLDLMSIAPKGDDRPGDAAASSPAARAPTSRSRTAAIRSARSAPSRA